MISASNEAAAQVGRFATVVKLQAVVLPSSPIAVVATASRNGQPKRDY